MTEQVGVDVDSLAGHHDSHNNQNELKNQVDGASRVNGTPPRGATQLGEGHVPSSSN